MKLRQDPKGWWFADYYDEKGRRKRPYLNTRDRRMAEFGFVDFTIGVAPPLVLKPDLLERIVG